MGQAIIAGWRSAGIDLSPVVAIRPSSTAVDGIRTVASYAEAGAQPKLVILAFKPKDLEVAAGQLRPWLTGKAIVVSLLAGVEVDTLRRHFPKARAIVRATPNLPVAIRRGIVALYSDEADEALQQELANIFTPLGFVPWMSSEDKLAAASAVSGAGPAYVARFIDALAKAGERRGLNREFATTLAIETVFGTAWLAASNGEAMESIARRVASPKGTTEAGLAILDKDNVLDDLIALTIDAAALRGSELGAEAKAPSLDAKASLA